MLATLPSDNLTREIIAAAIEVHRILGPGLLESVYSKCLEIELSSRKLAFATERHLPLVYKGMTLDCKYRLDLVVETVVVVEVKAATEILPVHQAQLLTYLKLTGLPVGLVINFNVDQLVKGIKRVINPRPDADKAAALSMAAGGGQHT